MQPLLHPLLRWRWQPKIDLFSSNFKSPISDQRLNLYCIHCSGGGSNSSDGDNDCGGYRQKSTKLASEEMAALASSSDGGTAAGQRLGDGFAKSKARVTMAATVTVTAEWGVRRQCRQTHNKISGLFHFGIGWVPHNHTQIHNNIYGLFHFGIVRPNPQQYLRIIPFWNSPSTPSQNMSYSTHIGIQWWVSNNHTQTHKNIRIIPFWNSPPKPTTIFKDYSILE